MYRFVVGFNEWMLKAYARKQKWRRASARGGWARGVSGQADAEFYRDYVPGCFLGMGQANAELHVVQPEDRGGFFPDPQMQQAITEAKKRGIRVVEVTL